MLFFEFKAPDAVIMMFVAGYTVAMETYCVMKMISM